MPRKPKKPCGYVGCSKLIESGSYCENHKIKRDKNRGNSNSRGYNYQWRKVRKVYLSNHAFCVLCEKEGIVREATVIDHIIPHRGNKKLFWDMNNWQPLCKSCHDKKTAEGL